MDARLASPPELADRRRSLAEAFVHERARLSAFIRRRVSDPGDAEDILQDAFHELVEASQFARPVEQVGAWLFRVVRNRIVDRFRKKKAEPVDPQALVFDGARESGRDAGLDDLLPAPDAGPEAAYARRLLLEEMAEALDELPEAQRAVFLAHELEGKSFRQLAEETGTGVNTLLARKHYAVRFLRRRLRAIHDEFIDN